MGNRYGYVVGADYTNHKQPGSGGGPPSGNYRLLEDGSFRLLEDGSKRELE